MQMFDRPSLIILTIFVDSKKYVCCLFVSLSNEQHCNTYVFRIIVPIFIYLVYPIVVQTLVSIHHSNRKRLRSLFRHKKKEIFGRQFTKIELN